MKKPGKFTYSNLRELSRKIEWVIEAARNSNAPPEVCAIAETILCRSPGVDEKDAFFKAKAAAAQMRDVSILLLQGRSTKSI